MTRRKRSRIDVSAMLIPWLTPPPGGSAGTQPPPARGGGSSDFRDISGDAPASAAQRAALADPRLAELQKIGVSLLWQRVAALLGFERFLALWELLATSSAETDDRNRVCVPAWRTYLRYERNRLIRTLAAAGHGPSRIREIVRDQLGEDITEAHIRNRLLQ